MFGWAKFMLRQDLTHTKNVSCAITVALNPLLPRGLEVRVQVGLYIRYANHPTPCRLLYAKTTLCSSIKIISGREKMTRGKRETWRYNYDKWDVTNEPCLSIRVQRGGLEYHFSDTFANGGRINKHKITRIRTLAVFIQGLPLPPSSLQFC